MFFPLQTCNKQNKIKQTYLTSITETLFTYIYIKWRTVNDLAFGVSCLLILGVPLLPITPQLTFFPKTYNSLYGLYAQPYSYIFLPLVATLKTYVNCKHQLYFHIFFFTIIPILNLQLRIHHSRIITNTNKTANLTGKPGKTNTQFINSLQKCV